MRSDGRRTRVLTTAAVLALVVVPAGVVAVVADDPGGLLAFVAFLLLGAALLQGLAPGPLPGTPAQNVGRVVVVGATVLSVLLVLAVAFVAWLWTGLCAGSCDDAPSRGQGILLTGALLLAACAAVAGGVWGWIALGRARDGTRRTSRATTLLPAAIVGAIALVSWTVEPGEPRRPVPVGSVSTVWAPPCGASVSAGPRCAGATGLGTAVVGDALVAVWRADGALLSASLRPGRPARVVRVATVVEPRGVRPGGTAVAATGDGGALVGWIDRSGLRLSRTGPGGDVRPVPGVRPGPASAEAAGDPAAGRTGDLALVPVPDGVVVFAVGRIGVPAQQGGGTRTAVRVLALDADLRPRGRWRTVPGATPLPFGAAGRTADGRAAAEIGAAGVRTVVSTRSDGTAARVLSGRILAAGAGGVREVAPPSGRGLPTVRRPPVLDSVVRDAAGVRSSWTTGAPRSGALPARVEQQWVLGSGATAPARPWADGLSESRLVPLPGGPVLVGLRPADTRRSSPAAVVVVRGPR